VYTAINVTHRFRYLSRRKGKDPTFRKTRKAEEANTSIPTPESKGAFIRYPIAAP
jgi:hypothetical protein